MKNKEKEKNFVKKYVVYHEGQWKQFDSEEKADEFIAFSSIKENIALKIQEYFDDDVVRDISIGRIKQLLNFHKTAQHGEIAQLVKEFEEKPRPRPN
jgi:hypothetical protein